MHFIMERSLATKALLLALLRGAVAVRLTAEGEHLAGALDNDLELEVHESRAMADAEADAEADARDGVAWHDMHIEEHLDLEVNTNWVCYHEFENHLVAAQHTEMVELGTLLECHMHCESMPDCAAVNFHKKEHQCHIKLGQLSQQEYTWALEESDKWDTCYYEAAKDDDEWWNQPTTTPMPIEQYLQHADCNASVRGSRLRLVHNQDAIRESGEVCKCRWHGLTGRLTYLQGDSIACDHHGLFHKFDPRVYAGCFCEDVWATCDRLVKGSLPRKVPEEGTNHFCKCKAGSIVTGPHANCPAPIYEMRKFNPYPVAGCSCEEQETSETKYWFGWKR